MWLDPCWRRMADLLCSVLSSWRTVIICLFGLRGRWCPRPDVCTYQIWKNSAKGHLSAAEHLPVRLKVAVCAEARCELASRTVLWASWWRTGFTPQNETKTKTHIHLCSPCFAMLLQNCHYHSEGWEPMLAMKDQTAFTRIKNVVIT